MEPTSNANFSGLDTEPRGTARKRPVQEIRLGYIKAAIWENPVGDGIQYSVSLTRNYKDGTEWKSSDNFRRDDLLVLAKVADQAHTWICTQMRGDRKDF